MRFPWRLEGSIDYAGGHTTREIEIERKRAVRGEGAIGRPRPKGKGMVGRGSVRQGGRVDAWARVRPRERDGDRGHSEEQGVAGRGR